MIDKSHDIFVQIDALLERRGNEILSQRNKSGDDFPMLTEVIDHEVSPALKETERRKASQPGNERRATDRRASQRRQAADSAAKDVCPPSDDSMNTAVEQRLTELFIVQQVRLEELIRRVVREELADKDGGQS